MAFSPRLIKGMLLLALLSSALLPMKGVTESSGEQAEKSPNAFSWYEKAGKLIDSDARDKLGRWDKLDNKEQRALLSKLSPVLKIVREGMNYPCRTPQINKLEDKMPWLGEGRNLARLFALESNLLAKDGHYMQATMSGLDAIHFGNDYSSGAPMIGHLVAIALQAIGRKTLWDYLPKLDSKDARVTAKRLEMISSRSTPYYEIFLEEKRIGTAVLKEFLNNPEYFRQTLEENAGDIDVSDDLIQAIYRPLILDALEDFPKQMDARIAKIKLPYQQWEEFPESNNLLTRMFLPIFLKGGFRSLENETFNRLLYISYALQEYHLERKLYPETLSSLCPDYLTSIPLDPFANTQPFKYSRGKIGYRLYSVGPDGKDDGGKAVEDPNLKEKSFQLQYKSTGDILAGVNID